MGKGVDSTPWLSRGRPSQVLFTFVKYHSPASWPGEEGRQMLKATCQVTPRKPKDTFFPSLSVCHQLLIRYQKSPFFPILSTHIPFDSVTSI